MNIIDKAIYELEEFLDNIEISFNSSDIDTIKNFNQLKNYYSIHGKFLIYSGDCENTIFSKDSYNVKLRAWHDYLHHKHNLSFTLEDELLLSQFHMKKEFSDILKKILEIEFQEQVKYYYKYGDYVENQKEFTKKELLKKGIAKELIENSILLN